MLFDPTKRNVDPFLPDRDPYDEGTSLDIGHP